LALLFLPCSLFFAVLNVLASDHVSQRHKPRPS
jgi:hypothetical protein